MYAYFYEHKCARVYLCLHVCIMLYMSKNYVYAITATYTNFFLCREATAAAQKQYDKMNEGVPRSAYQPTTSFTEGIPGTTATDSINFIEPFEEKQL